MRRDPSKDEVAEAEPTEGSHGEFVAVLDAGGRIVSCTPGLCALLGLGVEELAGQDIDPLAADRGLSIATRGALSLPSGQAVSIVELRGEGALTAAPAALREGDSFADRDPNPVLRVTLDGTLVYANRGSWILLAAWSTRVGAPVPDEWARTVREALERGELVETETRTGPGFIRLSFVPVPEAGYVNVYGIDTTRSRRAEEKLRLSSRVLDSARDASMVLDSELRILEVNRGFVALTGRDREEILGEIAPGAGVGLDGPEIWAAVRQMDSWEGPVDGVRKDGSGYPAWVSVESVTASDGETQGFIVVLSDMTAIREAEQQLFRLAHSDSLTGLANRRAFLDALERDLAPARRESRSLTVLRLDLDRFAVVNDDLGTATGDRALCEVARRIQRIVRAVDTVARVDGDEFLILLQDVSPSAAEAVSSKVRQAIAEPMTLGGQEILVTASAGSASFPGEKTDAAGLLSAAGVALRRSKQAGRNTHVSFTATMETRTGEQVMLQARLRRALHKGEFVVHYQPQVNAGRGSVSGLEALVRWETGTNGLVGPGGFMPFAEESGQVWEIGEHVLRTACAHGRRWQEEALPPVQIGVNVSPRQLARPGFVSLTEAVLRETGFPARLLELELTEGALIGDDSEILRKLRDLRSMGLSLAIDDFGTRYSTFSYLKRLPVNRLKIDASFVSDMGDGTAGTRIVAAIIAMGHSLKMEVVAEGVETETQVAQLRDLGCDHLQGFYFSRAVPEASVTKLFGRELAAAQS